MAVKNFEKQYSDENCTHRCYAKRMQIDFFFVHIQLVCQGKLINSNQERLFGMQKLIFKKSWNEREFFVIVIYVDLHPIN